MKRSNLWALLFLTLTLLPFNWVSAQDEVSDLLGRINNLRGGVGRAPYALNGALSAAAQDQAQWIVATGTVAHTRPDGNGVRTRAIAFGYPTTDVSENIYGGSNAGVSDAWSFWVNSGIHYRGLVNERYREIGIGIARGGWGAAFVLVFGNPGGPAPAPPPQSGGAGSSNASSAPAAPPQQPSYVRGLDEQGNILHEVQPGDTLGDILLIYGYGWAELPYLMSINGISDVRDLEVGTILKVPPASGTYTPTPGDPTAIPSETPNFPTPFPDDPMFTTPTALPTTSSIATAAAVPEMLLIADVPTTTTPVPTANIPQVAQVPTALPNAPDAIAPATMGLPTWLLIGLGVQVVVLIAAGIEFFRRKR
jgi:hypothetical protein